MAGAMNCSDCNAPITRQSKTGRCRNCARAVSMANPEIQAKRLQRLSERLRDPQVRAKVSRALVEAHRERMATDPAYVERRREEGRRLAATRLGHAAQPKGSQINRIKGQKLSDRRLGWCPREYRAFYQKMRRQRGKGADVAKRLTLEKIAADRAKMTPFERQMAALKRGASLVSNVIPDRREYDFSLGGASPL
jgi:hypothetical protein